MNNLFTGDVRQRRAINLGGASSNSGTGLSQTGDLVQLARKQREEREQNRLKEKAGLTIKAFVTGRRSAAQTRAAHRAQFDSILSHSAGKPESVLLATRYLVNLFVDGNAADIKRAAAWCRAVLVPAVGATNKTPLLFSLFAGPNGASWNVLLRQTIYILFSQATLHPSLPQAPLFLEIAKIVSDPASYTKWNTVLPKGSGETVLAYLLKRDLYEKLRKLLLAIPPVSRTHPSLPAAIVLSLLPFKAYPSPPPPPSRSTPATPQPPERLAALSGFLTAILTLPLLPTRLPQSSLTALNTALPLEDVLVFAVSEGFREGLASITEHGEGGRVAVNLLANVLAFGGMKVDKLSSGKVLSAYLELVRRLLDAVPKGVLVDKKAEEIVEDRKGKGKEVEVIVIDSSDEEDVEMDGGATAALKAKQQHPATTPGGIDPQTRAYLSILTRREHLVSVLTLSTRFSASTRPALAAFFVSLLHSLPSKRDDIINTLMYGPTTSSSATSTAAGERGGGLLRELWRGYIRPGPVGKLLAASQDRPTSLLPALSNHALEKEWPLLILLEELYSRCLLTLGDDEFYTQGKNPLSLDEVVELSGGLRNLAFGLYWTEGGVGGSEGAERKVIGTRVGVEKLRELTTTLLQQIHARDSRRSFTPKDHWLMTSQIDLASFIQTVVYEDEKLDAEGEEEPRQAAENDDDEEDHDFGPPSRRLVATAKAALLSKRQLAFISPRLGVLNNIPFVIPFETRVAIFRQFIDNDRKRLGIERHIYDRRQRHRAVVRRNHLSEDSYAHLNGLGAALKSTIEIVFIDEHGMEESGIDGGGLFKELLTSLSKEMFDTDRGLWLATAEQELYPNPHSYAREPQQLQWYTFIGRILGKALYEGILIDVRFASFFLAKWLGKQSYLDDLASLDAELYNGLLFLKNYTGNVETDLSLNFTVTEEDFGVSRTIELMPNGAETPVTNENRLAYIVLASHYRLNAQIAKQCEAFFGGLSEIIPARFLRLFNQSELRMLVGGVDSSIDIEDLKRNTVYGGWPMDEVNETVRTFWEVVEDFDKDDRAKLVKFVTSCARPPLLGFSQLNPRFAIRSAGEDQTRLPTSSTCVNLLKLPEYKDKENLRQKLRYAINSNAGFDLS